MKKSDALPSKYIRATDIGDREWQLTIVQTRMEKVGQDDTKPRRFRPGWCSTELIGTRSPPLTARIPTARSCSTPLRRR